MPYYRPISLSSIYFPLLSLYQSIDWLIDWFIHLFTYRLIDWLIYSCFDWLIDWLIFHFYLSILWLIDWLIDWFFIFINESFYCFSVVNDIFSIEVFQIYFKVWWYENGWHNVTLTFFFWFQSMVIIDCARVLITSICTLKSSGCIRRIFRMCQFSRIKFQFMLRKCALFCALYRATG